MSAKELFLAALEKLAGLRAGFLDAACGAEGELRQRVDLLLAAHEASDAFGNSVDATQEFPISPPLLEQAATELRTGSEPGARIAGRYVLLEKRGEGGMGEVWAARQEEPVRRTVALKLIKPGMDSRGVLARFDQERQALALMDHPNIAKVFDAGLVGEAPGLQPGGFSRPFFAMELVNGLPLTKFCDEAKLTPRQRLDLFVPICQAVQHAHQKGVIHRDLKPSNVLVALIDGRPVPKIIDFGVAKAAGGKLTDETLATQFGTVVGTLEYMAPEQASSGGEDVDTRADIYSLGVILYELLTGLRPFDSQRLKKAAFDEALRIIREEEPPRPSTRLSTAHSLPAVAAVRQTEPKRLTALMRGELDWIVMKALEKDRGRRYETANALARDVQRHLADEPVEARPPSAGYRLWKLYRRNRGPAIAAALVLLALLAGVVGSTSGMLWALRERDEKEQARAAEQDQRQLAQANEAKAKIEAAKAREATADMRAFGSMLEDDVLATARPAGERGGLGIGVTVRQAMDAAAARLPERFAGRPRAEAVAQHSFGVTYRILGEQEKAERHLRRAVELRERTLGPNHIDTLESRNSLAVAIGMTNRPEAGPLFEETLRRARLAFGPDHPLAVVSLAGQASALMDQDRCQEATPLFEEAARRAEDGSGADHPDTLQIMSNLATAHQRCGRNGPAQAQYEEVLRRMEARPGPTRFDAVSVLFRLGDLHQRLGRPVAAIPYLEKAYAGYLVHLGPTHANSVECLSDLGQALRAAARHDRLIELLADKLPRLEAHFGADHHRTLGAKNDLAMAYLHKNDPRRALRLLEEVARRSPEAKNVTKEYRWQAQANLASCLIDVGQADSAVALLEAELPPMRQAMGADDSVVLDAENCLGKALHRLRRRGEAIVLFEALLPRSRVVYGPDHHKTLQTQTNLAVNLMDMGRPAEAVTLLADVLDRRRKAKGPEQENSMVALHYLALAHVRAGQPKRAAELFEEEAALERKRQPGKPAEAARALAAAGEFRLEAGEFEAAVTALREALAVRKELEPQVWSTFSGESLLGLALLRLGRHGEAEPHLLAGFEGMKRAKQPLPLPGLLPEAAERLAQLYQAWDRPAEAAKWRKEAKALKDRP